MRLRLVDSAIGILGLCALVVTVLVIRRELAWQSASEAFLNPRRNRYWEQYALTGTSIGPSQAPVVITVFSDFQCPFCRAFDTDLDSLVARHPRLIRTVFHHFPLPAHPFARDAAVTAECAKKEGRFAEMKRTLFRNQERIGQVPWTWFAKQAGLDVSPTWFEDCSRNDDIKMRISNEIELGHTLPIRGTPTVLVNQWEFAGNPRLATLDSTVGHLLGSTK